MQLEIFLPFLSIYKTLSKNNWKVSGVRFIAFVTFIILLRIWQFSWCKQLSFKSSTATFTYNRCLASLWSNLGTFQDNAVQCTIWWFKTTFETIQMRYFMLFCLNENQNYQKPKFNLPIWLKLSKMSNPGPWRLGLSG